MPHSQRTQPFDTILEAFAAEGHYTIGQFLFEFFRAAPPGSRATGRLERHGKMLGAFLRARGTTSYGVGEILHQLDAVAGRFDDHEEPLYALEPSYDELKSGHAALTSYVAQKVYSHLRAEQRAAVHPEGGLHVFAPRKQGEPINMRLSWDTYGATTFEDVRTILKKLQPLTFAYIKELTKPKRHDPNKEYRYRPPNFVCEKLISRAVLNAWQVATLALCQINYSHNRNAKRLQVFTGILFLVNGATQTVLDYSSRMCITPSYNSILDTLKS